MKNLAYIIEDIKNKLCNPYYEIFKVAYNRGEVYELLTGHVKYFYDQNGNTWLYTKTQDKINEHHLALQQIIHCGIRPFYDCDIKEQNEKIEFKNEIIKIFKNIIETAETIRSLNMGIIIYLALRDEINAGVSFIFNSNDELDEFYNKAHYIYRLNDINYEKERILKKPINKKATERKIIKYYKTHSTQFNKFTCPTCKNTYIHDVECFKEEIEMTPYSLFKNNTIQCETCSKLTIFNNLMCNKYGSDKKQLINENIGNLNEIRKAFNFSFHFTHYTWDELKYLISQQEKGLLNFNN